MSLRPITVMVTASGAPGTAALLNALRPQRRARRPARRDRHERAPRSAATSVMRSTCSRQGADPAFADAMLDIARRRRTSTRSCRSRRSTWEGLAEHVDAVPRMPVLVSSPDAIHRSNDKAETYEFLHRHRRDGARVPARERIAPRSRLRRSSWGTRAAPCASSRCSRRARGASASSTRPSTARISCSMSGRARSRCGSRKLSSCSPDEGGAGSACDGARDGRRAHDRRLRPTAARSSSATRRRERRCAPAWRCTSSRSTTPELMRARRT